MPAGVQVGISDREYFAMKAINNSSLDAALIDTELFHLEHVKKATEPDDSAAMAWGRMAHALLLEPAEFKDRYVVANPPVNPKTGKPYGADTAKVAAWREEFADTGKVPLPSNDYEHAGQLCAKIRSHTIAGPLMAAAAHRELALVWQSTRHGLHLKCKLDNIVFSPDTLPDLAEGQSEDAMDTLDLIMPGWREMGGIIVDNKFTAEFDRWRSHCRKFHLYRQASFYTMGAEEVFGQSFQFAQVVAERSANLQRVKAVRFNDDDLLRGAEEIDEALRRVHECASTGDWHDRRNDQLQEVHLFKGVPESRAFGSG